MKPINRLVCLFVAALSVPVATSYGDEFDFSYTFLGTSPGFGGPGVVTGSFDGTQSGNLITDISDITILFDGNPFGSNFQQYGYNGSYVEGAAVVSIDGTQNDFYFFSGDNFGNPSLQSLTLYGYNFVDLNGAIVDQNDSTPISSRWSVTDVSTVPDGGATIALLGGALAGLTALRRRFAK